jgi:hypothetical protein
MRHGLAGPTDVNDGEPGRDQCVGQELAMAVEGIGFRAQDGRGDPACLDDERAEGG